MFSSTSENKVTTSTQDAEAFLSRPIQSAVQPRWQRARQGSGDSAAGDRFIPNREAACAERQAYEAANGGADGGENGGANAPRSGDSVKDAEQKKAHSEFQSQLAETLFSGEAVGDKILAFKNKAPRPSAAHLNSQRVLFTQNRQQGRASRAAASAARHVNPKPIRILDAPGIDDDYYLNVLDWSSRDVLAVALSDAVYLWNAETGSISMLCELPGDGANKVTSVRWMPDGSHLALGTSDNATQLWNAETGSRMRLMDGHAGRVSSLAWNEHLLSSGSRDSTIVHHDVRQRDHHVVTLQGHTGEVCGLQWSPDGRSLASGSNDNRLCIWDVEAATPRLTMTEHTAAVKAIAWSPHQSNLIASGGGTADRHIRFFNTVNGTQVNAIDTESQVSSLVWSPHQREILSGHGYSKNQLCVWRYPSLTKVAELQSHTGRVLSCCLSSDGTRVVSAGADESLRFWQVWEEVAKQKKGAAPGGLGGGRRVGGRNIR